MHAAGFDSKSGWRAMDSYLFLKTIHLVGVVIFIGNIVVTAWWKVMADLTRDPKIVAFAQRQVTLTDWVFTFGGVVLVAVGGIGNAWLHGMPMTTLWLALGNALFAASGLIWIAVLIPLQTKLARLAREFATATAIPERYWRLERLWGLFGAVATALPLANVVVMVFKFD
jgi:uncharacterized membrane protein